MAVSPSKKIYIGRTSQGLEKRKRDHQKEAFYDRGHGCPALNNAIIKYGFDSLIWTVLRENLSYQAAIRFELQAIKEYSSSDPDYGYNLLTHSDKVGVAMHSAASKQKISDTVKISNIEAWKNPERRARMSENLMAQWRDKRLRKQRTDAIKVVRSSDEQKRISSVDSTKRYQDPKKRDEMAIACGAREFMVINKNGEIIGSWINAAQCAKALGLASKGHISNCLHGRMKTYRGYTFKYLTPI
jgi:group I intron endonuclease